MEPIQLPEAIGSALPASLPGTGSGAPDAEETQTRVEFNGLAEALADLVRLTNPERVLGASSISLLQWTRVGRPWRCE